MGLADTGRTGKNEYGNRLLLAFRGNAPTQLLTDLVDPLVLPDDLRLERLGQGFGINCRQLSGLFGVSFFNLLLVGQLVENIHDEPRKIFARVKECSDRNDGRSRDEKKRQ